MESPAAAAWPDASLAPEAVEAVAQAVAERIEPVCIVLFGSYAAGAEQPHSDLDLLIVMETDRRPFDRTDPFRDVLDEAPAPVDAHVHTPAEVRHWRGTTNHLIHEAFEKGVVLYQAPGTGPLFPPTRPRPMEMAREFIEKADNDLFSARTLIEAEGGPTDTPAFHAQQAAEKGLKAILTAHQIDAPYTHDLEELLDLVPEDTVAHERLTLLREELGAISEYGVRIRYPRAEVPSREEARRAVELAERVMQAARELVER